jgi:hypothetical protein
MTQALTKAQITVNLAQQPIPTTNSAFASLQFGGVDAAGTPFAPVPVVPAAGASVAEAIVDITNAVNGIAVFSVNAVDDKGQIMGTVDVGSLQLGPVTPTTFPAPVGALTITLQP